jgi:hypothetical protein
MTSRRLQLHRDVVVIAEREDGIEIEGRLRLRPGHPIEIATDASSANLRQALVWSWQVSRVGPNGPMYRGLCRWT